MENRELVLALARGIAPEVIKGFAHVQKSHISPVVPTARSDAWWQRPGLGIMYQIECRPGWRWNRDFAEFNRSMTDEGGKLVFNGPFCKTEEWVELSKEVGIDYHIMEIKWHDGICYFDTKLTDWKTEEDYAGRFAEASRRAGIPFMYYYSSIFDHNPQFDPVQPSRQTVSFMGIPDNPTYDEYLRGQYAEIMEQYRPDGMWIDWYWPDQCTQTTIDFFRTNYPETVLAFNASNLFASSYCRIDYTSGEAHDLDGPYFKLVREEGGFLAVFSSTWKWAALNRRTLAHPWELITPAGRWWQDPSLRDDPYDLVRMAAITMASGGKLCMGVTAQMDGSVYPDQVEQLRILGEWYKPRRALFAESVPLRYRFREPLGVQAHPESVRLIACRRGDDLLLHLINMDGATRPIELSLHGSFWNRAERAYLEPSGKELQIEKSREKIKAMIRPEDIDRADTILRLEL